jgi:hypothetical protein
VAGNTGSGGTARACSIQLALVAPSAILAKISSSSDASVARAAPPSAKYGANRKLGFEAGHVGSNQFALAFREWRRASHQHLVKSDERRSGLRVRLEQVDEACAFWKRPNERHRANEVVEAQFAPAAPEVTLRRKFYS